MMKSRSLLISFCILVLVFLTSFETALADNNILKYDIISETEVAVSAASQDIEGNVIIPSSVVLDGKEYIVTSISDKAFFRCLFTKSIYIPKTIKYIGVDAFYYNERLEKIEVANDNPIYRNVGLFVVDEKDYIVSYPGKGETELTIPSTMKGIREKAFGGCQSLKSVYIPSSIKQVGILAFNFCMELTSVIWDAEASTVPSGCFHGCASLKEVTVSKFVSQINGMAFYGTNLDSIVVKAPTPPSIVYNSDTDTFGASAYNNATLYVPKGSVDAYKSNEGWKMFRNIEYIKESVDETNSTTWYMNTDTGLQIPMFKVGMLVATDDEDYFYILDVDGSIIAEEVKRVTFSKQNSTGINEFVLNNKDKEIKRYVNGKLYISGGEGYIYIYSLSGKLHIKEKISSNETSINVSNLPSGTYVLVNNGLSFKFNKK